MAEKEFGKRYSGHSPTHKAANVKTGGDKVPKPTKIGKKEGTNMRNMNG